MVQLSKIQKLNMFRKPVDFGPKLNGRKGTYSARPLIQSHLSPTFCNYANQTFYFRERYSLKVRAFWDVDGMYTGI